MRLRVLATAAALGLLSVGSAAAQSAASRIDQPTPGTLPPGTSTVPGNTAGEKDASGRVTPPSAIQSSTDVMTSADPSSNGRTDPVEHLPGGMR